MLARLQEAVNQILCPLTVAPSPLNALCQMCAHFQMGLQGNRPKGLPPRGSSSSHYMGFPKPARQPAFAHSGSLKPSCSSLTLIDSILCECFKCWLAGNEAIIMQNAARKPLQIIRDARPSLCIGNEATRGQRASAHTCTQIFWTRWQVRPLP